MELLAGYLKEHLNNRSLYIWGAWESGYEIELCLEKYGINISGYIDSSGKRSEFHNKKVELPIFIEGKKQDIFIVLSIAEHENVIEQLDLNCYEEYSDYIYMGKEITISNCNNFMDLCGNVIKGKVKNIKAIMTIGSQIEIGKNVTFGSNVILMCMQFSKIVIGDNCVIEDNALLQAKDFSQVVLGEKSLIGMDSRVEADKHSSIIIGDKQTDKTFSQIEKNGLLLCSNNSEISIGSQCSFGANASLVFAGGSYFRCGTDCRISYDVCARGDDGHTIIDLKEQCIHTGRRNVVLEDHVWVGLRTTLLPGTYLKENTIVGAQSVTTKEYEKGCIVAGIPAKVIRTDVTWDGARKITYEEYLRK